MKYLIAFLLLLGVIIHSEAAVPNPVKAIYIDYKGINWNAPQQTVLDAFNAGWNVVILAFYLSGGTAADMAQAWQSVPSATQQSTIDQIHSKGGIVLVSLGGSTDSPFSRNANTVGQQVATWARNNHLDGVDFDLENFQPSFRGGSMSDTDTVDWVANVTNAARSVLGANGVISHAPQAPYFGAVGGNTWAGRTGGYSGVYRKATSINFFNVQFYNQGASCYVDYNGLFSTSCSTFPGTAVNQIAQSGIPLEKIVVGKYITTGDASNGYVAPATLHTYFNQAKSSLNWNAGVMAWVWGDANTCSAWIKAAYP